ncbi:DNA ligase 1-like [Rhincodon typus]|uniref:DNA ligase 1-like n=1 Tax=Rhincodon typus TaxID=259920 RepID=UPI00203028B0|nr:DNA ligase 1-like [Rhincodon typus]XP_048473538.1 DNA ligase 1-like [Rhincodon typus]
MVSSGLDTMPLCSPLAKQKICTDTPTPGALQQHLFYGEYDPFKYAPIFESDFVQVTKKGEVLNIHNQVTVVTVGVTSTSPNFNLPNVMLLARPINALREMMCNCTVSEDRCPMELTRLFPLSFVNISIHDVYNRRLRLKLANGRAFYLQLYVHPDCENEVFERWMKLVTLLHTNPEEVYGYEAVTPEIECILEQASLETSITTLSDWQLEPPEMSPGMREYYEASRASSKKSKQSKQSKKSKKSDKSEKTDCSERTQSKREGSDDESLPDFDREQEPWPLVEPPKKEKKSRGKSIGFNFFNKGSKEKLEDKEKQPQKTKAAASPSTPSVPAQEKESKVRLEKEGKGDRNKKESKPKDKSKGKEGKGDKEKKKQKMKEDKEREKVERQQEKERQQREKEEKKQKQKEGRKQKGKDDKRGKEKEKRQRQKEERQQKKEAKQREKEEKKQRELEDRREKGKDEKRGKEKEKRQRGNEDKKQKDKKKQSKPSATKSKEKVEE